ncbi:MAG: DUF4215 domain-containing protein [Kofleriaceae bacterium]
MPSAWAWAWAGALALVIAGTGGCLADDPIACAEGWTCPSGTACHPVFVCVTDAQRAACAGKAEGDACQLGGASNAACSDGVCIVPACGNARIDPGEVCDDGNTDDGDGCSRYCDSDELCGNGVRDGVEECDDGNTLDHDGCQSTCLVQRCGDLVVDPDDGEVCDDGNLDAGDGCRPDCRSDETCGNGELDFFAGERCDDGGLVGRDGCDGACQPEGVTWEARGIAPGDGFDMGAAYDAARGLTIVQGGRRGGAVTNETWTYAGGQWTRLTPADAPSRAARGRCDGVRRRPRRRSCSAVTTGFLEPR